MALSRKITDTITTYDPTDCTSSGYVYTAYADGHVTAEYHTRWAGGVDGARWITDADCIVTGDILLDVVCDPMDDIVKISATCKPFDAPRANHLCFVYPSGVIGVYDDALGKITTDHSISASDSNRIRRIAAEWARNN